VNPPLYAGLLTWHAVFYISALIGWWFQRSGRRSVLFAAQLIFVALSTTTVAALWDAVRGRFRATWQKVNAKKEPEASPMENAPGSFANCRPRYARSATRRFCSRFHIHNRSGLAM